MTSQKQVKTNEKRLLRRIFRFLSKKRSFNFYGIDRWEYGTNLVGMLPFVTSGPKNQGRAFNGRSQVDMKRP